MTIEYVFKAAQEEKCKKWNVRNIKVVIYVIVGSGGFAETSESCDCSLIKI